MKLLDFYTAVLSSADIIDQDGEGMLSAHYNGAYNPVTVGGKRLVLPTSEILRAGNWTDRTAFHPMCEKITRSESPVLKLLKDAISLRTDATFSVILEALMHTAASPDLHKKIGGPKVAEYLKHIPTPTEKSYKVTKKILEALKLPEYRLVNYYLKHGGKGDEAASRTCVVSFPIFEELEDINSKTVFGVKISAPEKKNLLGLLEYVFGDADTRAQYSYGSRNPEAPYFHSLLTSFYKVATRMNVLLEKHKKHVPDALEMKIDLDWAECLDTFALFRGMIPSLEGNEGAAIVTDEPVPDLKERAQRAFNRPEPAATEKPDLPWHDEPPKGGHVLEPSRPAPVARRPEPTRASEPSDPLEAFRSQFQREKKEDQDSLWGGGRSRRDQPRGFATDFRDDRSGRRDERPARRSSGFGGQRHI